LLTGCSSTNPNRKTDSGVPAHLHEPATPANVAMFRSEKTKDVLVEYDESSVNVDKIVRRAYWVDENDQRILNSKKPNFVNPASIPDLTPIPVIPETDPQATNSTEPLCAILSTNGIAFSLCSSGRVIATRDLPVYEHKSVDVGGTALAVGKGVLIVIGTVIAIAGAIALSAAIYYAFGLAQGGSSNEHY
jgi:hypothetical protein